MRLCPGSLPILRGWEEFWEEFCEEKGRELGGSSWGEGSSWGRGHRGCSLLQPAQASVAPVGLNLVLPLSVPNSLATAQVQVLPLLETFSAQGGISPQGNIPWKGSL